MNTMQCNKCQSTMQLQSESLTEEFWVCTNSRCNTWTRQSSVIHRPAYSVTESLSDAMYSLFNQRVFNLPFVKMMFDTEKNP